MLCMLCLLCLRRARPGTWPPGEWGPDPDLHRPPRRDATMRSLTGPDSTRFPASHGDGCWPAGGGRGARLSRPLCTLDQLAPLICPDVVSRFPPVCDRGDLSAIVTSRDSGHQVGKTQTSRRRQAEGRRQTRRSTYLRCRQQGCKRRNAEQACATSAAPDTLHASAPPCPFHRRGPVSRSCQLAPAHASSTAGPRPPWRACLPWAESGPGRPLPGLAPVSLSFRCPRFHVHRALASVLGGRGLRAALPAVATAHSGCCLELAPSILWPE